MADVSEIVSDYGAYYINEGQNASRIKSLLFKGNDMDKLFQLRTTTDTKMRFAKSDYTRVLQPFQKTYTPLGEGTFEPRDIDLYQVKYDVDETPDDVEATWLGFLAGLNENDRAKWPLIKWLIENKIIPRFNEDKEMNEAYLGEYAAPTAGTPGAAGTAMNGVKKIINDGVDDGLITPITMGAWATDPVEFCTQMEEFVKEIPKEYRMKIKQLAVKNDFYDRFREGKQEKYNMYYRQEDSLDSIKLHPNISLVGINGMGDSEKVWTTVENNAIRGVKSNGRMTPKVESNKREVSIMGDVWTGYGFPVKELVFTTEHDPTVV